MSIGTLRYKKLKEQNIVSITFRMTKDEREQLNQAAKQLGQSQNNFILDAVQERINTIGNIPEYRITK